MKTKHTPGPWKVYERKEWSKECGNGGEGFSGMFWIGYGETDWRGPADLVDNVGPWSSSAIANKELSPIAKANAQLIAAAPEMLEALEKMKETLEIFKKGSSFSMNYELCLINQAIAKAKGE